MKRIILILTLVLSAATMQAQIGVASFSEDKTCQDARVHYPRRDKDGVLSALVKISTTEQDFNFETGSLGIVATEYRTGEVWLYLPAGTMKLKITHARLGSLEGDNILNGYYEFTSLLESGHVYTMKLTHEHVQQVMGEQSTVDVSFRCNMPDAEIFIGKEQKRLETQKDGFPTVSRPPGQLSYTVRKPDYADTSEVVVVHSDTMIQVYLRPLFGHYHLLVTPETANISIDNLRAGAGSVNKLLDNGTYKVQISQPGYHDTSFFVRIHSKDESQYVELRRIYGYANVKSYPAGATVYIDGQRVGTTPCLAKQLTVGKHILRIEHPQKATIQREFTIDGERGILLEYELAPNAKIQCLRDRAELSQFGFDMGYVIPSLPEVGMNLYFPKAAGLTFEMGASCNLTKSNTYYIYSPEAELLGMAEYRAVGGYAGLGFGIPLGDLLRLTPVVGVNHYRLISSLENDPASQGNGTGLYFGAGVSYALACHLHLFVRPQYHIPLHQSAAFQALSHHEDSALRLTKGFRLKMGININF